MSRHPLEEHFAECFVTSSATPEQLQHIRQCAQCREELQQFEGMVALLKDAVHDNVDRQLSRLEQTRSMDRRSERAPQLLWRWALAAVVFSVGALPLIFHDRQLKAVSPADSDREAAALMESIDTHISRDLPAPMEPLMLVVPLTNPKP